ncbi:SIS domain-containing protein [Candidatus Woesearchaeota archaeon]|nr:SIS domain-containing protein [Candidatus Woesearchaeota archaeon]
MDYNKEDSCGKFSKDYFTKLEQVLEAVEVHKLDDISDVILNAYKTNNQIFLIGNGGSAAIASHAVCDLSKGIGTGLVVKGRKIRCISLTDNTPLLMALGNDLGYENVFVGQLESVLNEKDVLIAISSSGKSQNIINAVNFAKTKEAKTIGFTGFDGGSLKSLADYCIVVPSNDYTFVEDSHQIMFHLLAKYVISKINNTNQL